MSVLRGSRRRWRTLCDQQSDQGRCRFTECPRAGEWAQRPYKGSPARAWGRQWLLPRQPWRSPERWPWPCGHSASWAPPAWGLPTSSVSSWHEAKECGVERECPGQLQAAGLCPRVLQHLWPHLIPATPPGRSFALSFTGEETEVPRGGQNCLRSQGQWLVERRWETRSS